MQNKKYVSFLLAGLLIVTFIVALPVFAQTPPAGQARGFGRGMGNQQRQPGIFGTVSSVNGTNLTVTSTSRVKPGSTVAATTTTYTVDASNATVTKSNTASTVASIAVGDTVMVQGTISGTNVTAKTIRDGVLRGPAQGQPKIQGNGQPVVAGKVASISGNTITITNASNVTYTVDITSAKFVENGVASPTISNVVVGDNLVIQGTVNGNSVVASSVIDQKAKVGGDTANPANNPKPKNNFFGGIGNFFKKLFGF